MVFTACAKFCGKFKDEHADSPEQSDDSDYDESFQPKDHQQVVDFQQSAIKRLKKKKGKTKVTDQTVKPEIFWRAKQVRLEVEQEGKGQPMGAEAHVFVDAVVCKNMHFTLPQLKHLKTLSYLHTIELVKCGLTECPPDLAEVENLHRVNFSSNKIQQLHKSMMMTSGNRPGHLRRIVLDNNLINYIEVGCVTGDAVKELLVFNMANNRLSYLPGDFLQGAVHLEYCDLSGNNLQTLPNSVLSCKKLRVLDLCCNDMRQLPDDFSELNRIRKLFLQSNKLKQLPPRFQELRHLEKLWVSQNDIRYLPYDLIDLWKGNGGMLIEIAVDENPLVSPSITAYQVGGPDQMFKLFAEERREEMRKKQQEEEALALANLRVESEKVALQEIELTFAEGDAMPEEGIASAPRMTDERQLFPVDTREDFGVIKTIGDIDGMAREDSQASRIESFWFKDLENETQNVRTIRSMEASFLLLKRSVYVEQLKKSLTTRVAGNQKMLDALPEKAKKYLDPKFQTVDFHGRAHVIEFDIYFCLFASCARTDTLSAVFLFKDYCPNGCKEARPKNLDESEKGWTCKSCSYYNSRDQDICSGGSMKRKEFDYLCGRVPIQIPDEVQNRMWHWMKALHKHDRDEVGLLEFVAAFHIHDIVEKDPFVTRVASVLRLLYYKMEALEFEEMLRNRSSPTARPMDSLDFPSDDEELFGAPAIVEGATDISLETLAEKEGERRQRRVEAPGQVEQTKGKQKKKQRNMLISMTETQYWERQGAIEEEEENELGALVDGEYDVSSDQLSESDLSDSSFDADDCLEKLDEMKAVKTREEKDEAMPLAIVTDSDLKKLMMMPAKTAGAARAKNAGAEEQDRLAAKKLEKAKQAARLAEKKKEHLSASMVKDPRFVTNMLSVRKAVRELFRNLPYYDFVAFVNFLLRKAKDIRHNAKPKVGTHWDISDPSGASAGISHSTNPYPIAVLKEMGFVLVLDKYWVWPETHLRKLGEKNCFRLVPANSAGLDENRLDDVIKLISRCKKKLDNTRGRPFKGNV